MAAGEVRSEAGEGEDPIPIPGSVLAVEVNDLADIAAGEVRSEVVVRMRILPPYLAVSWLLRSQT
jgi:hypothetical protein